ncbi:MAG: hypothetical protein M3167_08055 [Acidobacteriota bacterium]|nr:hypothetical protein [Acidobacteriota bacterium]
MSDNPGLWLLFKGVFVVWVPTLILLRRIPRSGGRKAAWKIALRNAPPVPRRFVYGSFAYCGIVWVVSIIDALLGRDRALTNEGIYFSAAMLVIYATAGAVSSSVLAMETEESAARHGAVEPS